MHLRNSCNISEISQPVSMAILSIGQVPFLHHQKSIPVKTNPMSNRSFHHTFLPHETKVSTIVSHWCSSRSSMQQLVQPPPIIDTKDLKVTIHKTNIVSPTEVTERRTRFLSNIDQRLNFKTSTVQFFPKNPDFPFENIVENLEMACSKVLVPYDFFAGRLKWNIEQGRFEIDCNSAGAGFVVASSELRLEDLGDLVTPKVYYQQLALRKWNSSPGDQPLLVIQVTSFKCSGFAVGYTFNHIAVDGIASKVFLQNLASFMGKNALALAPYNDRTLLAARSPPRVTFPHPEFINLKNLQEVQKPNPIPLMATFQRLECKVFNISVNDMAKLKQNTQGNTSSFTFVAAHIWRCVALAKKLDNDLEKKSTILYAINIRPRVRPRLPTSYSGNAILNAHWTTTYRELEEAPIAHLAEMITNAATRMTNEYIRSTIDWGELHKGFPNGDMILTSWWKLGLNDIEYPWGRAKWSCPVVLNHGNNAAILLPDVKGTEYDGVNVLISLPHKEMDKFQCLFQRFLEQP